MSAPRLSEESVKSATSPISGATQPQPSKPSAAKKQAQVAQRQMSQASGPNPFDALARENNDTDDYSVNGEISRKRGKGTTADDDRRIRKLKEGAAPAADLPTRGTSSDTARDAGHIASSEADRAEAVDTGRKQPVGKSAAEAQREFLVTTAPMPKAAKSAPLLIEPARSLEQIMHGDPLWKRSKQADAHLRAHQVTLV